MLPQGLVLFVSYLLDRNRRLKTQLLDLKVWLRASLLISLGLSFHKLNRNNSSTHLLSYCEGSLVQAVTGVSGSPLVVVVVCVPVPVSVELRGIPCYHSCSEPKV